MKTSPLGRITLATGLAVLVAGVVPGTASAAPAQRRMLPVLVEFQDAGFQFPDKVKATTPGTYFTGKDSAASFMTEVSRGQFTYVPAVEEQFLGPITLPITAADCKHGQINTLTREALAERGLVAGEDYDSISIVFPAQKAACPWAGLASVPGPTSWINLYGTDSGLGVVGHELGHNLGFAHQGRLVCAGGNLRSCEPEGGSGKSIMGGGGPGAGFTAPEMIRAGWLGGSTRKVTKTGTYTLRSLHGKGSGTRALDIALGKDRLVIEYRHAAGTLDANLEGVHAYRVPGGSYGSSSLIDTTGTQRKAPDADAITTLRDKAHRVAVSVVSSGGGQAVIEVALGADAVKPKTSASASPSASMSASASAGESVSPGAAGGDSGPLTGAGSPADLTAAEPPSRTLSPAAIGGGILVALIVGAILVRRRRPRGKHA
ncbi:hypothetical protein [Actinoplanes sp. NPDC049802]|uniref:hypothetical protein n=1 Tax=Actinoplanes sp. NPDC049802 TaxID=3154742 RepID=UPI0033F5638E